jgi:hypothetical protein
MAWISDGGVPDAASAQEELEKPIKVNFDTGG